MRTVGLGTCSAAVDDAMDPVPVHFLLAQIKAKPLAYHDGEEAANRVLLSMGRAHG
jgi:hypothetical protein